jgi:hypothetical protein
MREGGCELAILTQNTKTKIEKSNEGRGVVRQRERANGQTLRPILMPHRQSKCRKVVHVQNDDERAAHLKAHITSTKSSEFRRSWAMEVEAVGVLGVTQGSVPAEDQHTAQDFVRKSGIARERELEGR